MRIFRALGAHHFFGSTLIVAAVTTVLALRVTDRRNFADSELYKDVADRWGAPIAQPMPSVRFVPSGAVFTTLSPLPLTSQKIRVDAAMSYRKRGLVYFSGFDFALTGDFTAKNDQGRDVDVVFVLPISLETNKVMLSDLALAVNGKPVPASLAAETDKLVWTGRLGPDEEVLFHVAFRGRGLDSFVYRLDPAAEVKDFELALNVTGGDNIDYPAGVAPATEIRGDAGAVQMLWRFGSLESGISVGAILPSERSYDTIISTIVERAWAPWLLFFVVLAGFGHLRGRRLAMHEAYIIAAAFALFFVLVAYWTAIMHFYAAWLLAFGVIGTLLVFYLRRIFGDAGGRLGAALSGSALLLPSLAVMLQGYTGLVYALETLGLLIAAMVITHRDDVRRLLDFSAPVPGGAHVS
jgi:hypothetical protein